MGQNRASKSHLHITLRISRFLQSFQQIKLLKDNSSRQNHLVIVGFLGWPYYISSPGTGNRNFIVLFHNSISSWNSSYLYGRLILSQAIYIYHTAFFPTHLYQDRFIQQNQLHLSILITGTYSYATISTLYIKVFYCDLLKPPLNLSCRPVMDYFISSHPTEIL